MFKKKYLHACVTFFFGINSKKSSHRYSEDGSGTMNFVVTSMHQTGCELADCAACCFASCNEAILAFLFPCLRRIDLSLPYPPSEPPPPHPENLRPPWRPPPRPPPRRSSPSSPPPRRTTPRPHPPSPSWQPVCCPPPSGPLPRGPQLPPPAPGAEVSRPSSLSSPPRKSKLLMLPPPLIIVYHEILLHFGCFSKSLVPLFEFSS